MKKNKELPEKVKKNLLDLKHERYLTKTHTVTNLTAVIIISFLGLMGGGIIQNKIPLTIGTVYFTLTFIGFILTFFVIVYKGWKSKRLETVGQIMELDEKHL